MQPSHAMGFVGGHPCGYDAAVHVLDNKGRAGKFLVIGEVTFADKHFCGLVGAGVVQHHQRFAVIGESDLHRLLVDIVAERGADFLDDVISAVGGGVLVGTTTVVFTANGNITVKIGVPICIAFGAGGYQVARYKQQFTVCAVNIIGSVEIEHCTGKVFAGFTVNLVNTDFGPLALIVEFQGLLLDKIVVRILAAHNLKALGRCSTIILGNAYGHNHIIQLVIPCKSDIIAVSRTNIAIRRLGFLDMVAAQRQGHADLANRAIMDNGQKIVGCLGAGRGKSGNICVAVAGSNYRDHIALGVPKCALTVVVSLPILRVNVLGGGDGVLCTGQRAGFVNKITVLGFVGHPRVKSARFCFPVG